VSFLRQEGEPYGLIATRAGEYTADWTVSGLTSFRRATIQRAPPGLRAYLEHPAHEALGTLFFDLFEEALMYDFAVKEGASGVADLLD